MENTKFIYAANSDLDDELFYAEFKTKDEAINYAMDHLDKLPFVDEIELAYDAEGTEDAISYKTIWDYTMAVQEEVAVTEDEDETFWDFSITQEAEAQANKYDLGDTTWFESLDNLVEDMEENEDMVECKECFDLFPKVDCVKLAFGYICPHCNKNSEVVDSDIFKVEFPEYKKFSDPEVDVKQTTPVEMVSDSVPVEEPIENDSISTPEEAVDFLVKDEKEAIAGYEQAAEVVEDSDVENKEEILDTIDHIKEEEEEHVEELQDLMDDEIVEVENDPISDEAKEVEETAVDVEESEILTEDSELKTWICWYEGKDIGTVEAVTEEEAAERMMIVYPEYQYNNTDWNVELANEEYLTEHVNKECPAIESDQKLEGTDNAVVDCKVADVVTHSKDEKPVDCKGEKKPLEKPLTEGFIFSLNNEKDLAEFTKLCQEVGITTIGDLDRFTKETAEEPGNVLDKLRAYRKELGTDFKINEAFTKEEQEEYNMDEDGNSLDSYDHYVRCTWCDEIFTEDQCVFEADMGWLCDRCYEAILSRGEKLTIIKNPTEEDEARIFTEDVEDENELISTNPEEKLPKNLKMANTASLSGMDFEAACEKFGVNLEN